MKKNRKKLTLHRDTIHQLSGPALHEAGGGIQGTVGGCSIVLTCNCTVTCLTVSCPTRCGQWYC